MNTKQIDCVLELACTLNFRRAAENLFISQPALSYQIQSLETEIGFTVFDREGKSVALTPAGTQFCIALRRIRTDLRAAIEEGHKAGAKSCTHAQGMSGIKAALRAGIDSIEHGFYMDDWCFEWMKEHGTTFVPTLTAVYYTKFSEAGIPEFARKKVDAAYEDHLNTFRGAYKAGVNIALGTDAGTPNNYPNQTGFEMVLMEKAGMSKWDAIKAGTINSAKLVGVEKTHGTIEAGKKANFTVYTANPIEDMNNVMDCCMTVIGGEVVYKK